jgi:quinone-modifying oxidoreductase subunit QmoA
MWNSNACFHPEVRGNGKLERPSDRKQAKEIAFVQCAGSRDENHLEYCSAVCCSASLKHALNVVEKNPEAKVRIFYIDLRVTGRNEDFLIKVQTIRTLN